MSSQLSTWIGYAAGTLTTLAFLPQVLHVWRRKSARDLHWANLISFTVGISLWLIYGLATCQWPVILPNLITLILQVGIISLKLRYQRGGEME